jgi:glycerol-3-phosphate acyltransferase PlsY
MINYVNLSALLLAYLLGSIPTAVWIGRAFYGVDVREYGSGNAGATNTFRVLGPRAGLPVLAIDIAKGLAAVQLAAWWGAYLPDTQQQINFKLALGVGALLGHLFPVFAGFRGGKGVATLLGVLLGVHPATAGLCAGVFLVMFLATQFVSLSSMAAALAYPFITMVVYKETIATVNLFAMAIAILVFVTHQKNIERLLRGTESKVSFFARKAAKS